MRSTLDSSSSKSIPTGRVWDAWGAEAPLLDDETMKLRAAPLGRGLVLRFCTPPGTRAQNLRIKRS